jgi:hypothetical protein
MRRLNPLIFVLVAALLAVMLIAYVFSGGGGGGSRENPDKLTDADVAGRGDSSPGQDCGTQPTFDLVKRELFRRAAQLRGADPAQLDQIANYSVLRMGSATFRSEDEATGAISCSGSAALDLPPGVSANGSQTVSGDIGYALQPAADGSGQVVTLSNADALIGPLATLVRGGATQPEQASAAAGSDERTERTPPRVAEAPPAPAPVAAPRRPAPTPAPPRRTVTAQPRPPAPAEPPRATARPSFNCRLARARSEIAVCSDPRLAALDRQMASQFYGAMRRGNAAQRAVLQRTRGSFLAYRNRCSSNACIDEAYRGRMREISDIMAGRWRVP